jgi:hypothetical protein
VKRFVIGLILCIALGGLRADETLTCRWEDPKNAEGQKYLNKIWKEAQVAAGMKAKKPRPRVCIREGAWPMTLNGVEGLLCGYYTPERNDMIVMLDERCGDVRCLLIHEYLHAIMGSGHKGHSEVMERAGCAEEPSE